MDESRSLAGQTALVSGVSGAIGEAVAGLLKTRGAHVIGFDRLEPQAGSHLDEFVEVELGSASSFPSIQCPAKTLDYVIHLAGGALREEVEGRGLVCDRSVIDRTLNDNFNSLIDLLAITQGSMVTGSSITAVSSINALRPFGLPLYSAAKGAVNSFITAMAPDLARQGVRINAIALGTVEHKGVRELHSSDKEHFVKLKETLPDREFLTLEEAAESIVAIAADAPGIVGSVTLVDKGQSNFIWPGPNDA